MTEDKIPEDDSPDLTDEEIAFAMRSDNTQSIAQRVSEYIQEHPGVQLEGHELRRRKPHLFWRVRLKTPTGKQTLLFLADWLQQAPDDPGVL